MLMNLPRRLGLTAAALTAAGLLAAGAAPSARASSGWAPWYWTTDTNYCLADPTGGGTGGSGTDVVLWWCQSGANFLWQQVQITSGAYKGMFHLKVAYDGGTLCLYDHNVADNVRLQVVTCSDSWAGQAFFGNPLGYGPPPEYYPWTWFDPNEAGGIQESVSMPFAPQNGAWIVSAPRDDPLPAQEWDGPGTCFELSC
jgi:hypothetical protein